MRDISKLNEKLEKYDLNIYQRDNKYHRDYMDMFSSNGTFELVSTKEYDKFRKVLFEFSEGTPSLVHENFINLNNREDSLLLPHKAMFKNSRYDNDKLGSVLEINEESLNYIPQLYAYDMHCYNNILFTKEIDIENINLDFLDEAIKITNENDFVESRRHFYENKNYDGLLKHYAENDIIDKDNYYKLVAESAIFDSNAFLRNKEADYLAAKNNVEMKE